MTLMSWDDSNMAGDRWTWNVFIRRRSDGTFSVGARQRGNIEGGGHRIGGNYRLRSGEQVLSAIENLFMHEVLQNEEPNWTTIIRSARKFDASLARVLKHALKLRTIEFAVEVIEDARQGWYG